MKVYCAAPHEDWICDRIANEWNSYRRDLIPQSIYEIDVIWLLASWCWKKIDSQILRDKKVVATIHHIVPDKMTSDKYEDFIQRDNFVDYYHVPNIKTYDQLRKITNKKIELIPYWYDSNKWFLTDKEEAQIKFNLKNNSFKIGSFQRDTEGIGDKLPKLEKGPDIFCDLLESNLNKLPSQPHVVLAGWRRDYIKKRLSDVNINFSEYEKVSLETLRFLYACLDLYVVSSRHEGGPQAILEAAAMRIPIISTDVGLSSTILSKRCIIDMPQQFIIPNEDDIDEAYENVQKHEIDKLGKKYVKFFEGI